MTVLFESEADLLRSGYLFRITDNGGATCDRFTIITCDGDYFGASETQGFFQYGSEIDLQALADRIETGEERDIRWIDLPEDVRRAVLESLNDEWRDYLNRGRDQGSRRDALQYVRSGGAGLYRTKRGYFVIPAGDEFRKREDDYGPFTTFREAVLATLPDRWDLAGPEYHAPAGLLDNTGKPQRLWDCRLEPPQPYEVIAAWRGGKFDGRHYIDVGEARDKEHALELAAEWRANNPRRAYHYKMLIGSKADRTFVPLSLETGES